MTDASQLVSLGNTLCREQRWQEAIEAYRRALAIEPGEARVLSNLSVALLRSGRVAEALQCAKQAFALDHSNAAICANLGACLIVQGQWSGAAQAFQAAVERDPTNGDLWRNLGLAFQSRDSLDEALNCFRRAVQLEPNQGQAHAALGNCLKERDEIDEAIECYRQALQFDPQLADAHNNLGAAYELQGRFDEAATCYRRAIELRPDLAEAHWNQSVLMLMKGDFERGWPEYQWQFKKIVTRTFEQPQWQGKDIAGKTILLSAEQALGDTIHFIRYAKEVKGVGARVVVETLRPLLRLAASCAGIDQLVARGDPLPTCDVYAPLLSLPGIFNTMLETIPASVPYLFAEPRLIQLWHDKLESIAGLRIGVNWRGSGVKQARQQARQRDIPLELFGGLCEFPGVVVISLQKGSGTDELVVAQQHFPIVDLGEFDTQNGPFMDTAAIMMNLDLVITSDTSIAHLAGALGVPVWVALPYVPDWRWLLDRSDSPWYPTMRLFRQKKAGDWAGVFEEVEAALRERVS